MIAAIMQPYFFPYLPYFQLVNAADTFVVLDDVNFIKGGWINRNRITVNGHARYITVPCAHQSQNRLICDTEVAPDPKFRSRMVKTIARAYGNSPQFNRVMPLVERVVNSNARLIGEFAEGSIREVCAYLGIQTDLVRSSTTFRSTRDLRGAARLVEICRQTHSSVYVNLPGGRLLYEPADFAACGIELKFVCPADITYRQYGEAFAPDLSIVDVLMFNRPEDVSALLTKCSIE